MEVPLKISFKNMEASPWLEQIIQEKAGKLERFCKQIIGCHVTVEMPHRHHHKGNSYRLHIDIIVPDKEIAINREATEHAAAENISAVVHEAFSAARRQLEDYVRVRRQQVKTHQLLVNGKVVEVFPDKGYGFLESADGRSIYFHAHSLLNEDFNKVHPGSMVVFAEEEGDKGPQASMIKILKRRCKASV